MKRFIQGEHRGQGTFLPQSLDAYVSDTNPVGIVDVFVDELDLVNLGFDGAIPMRLPTSVPVRRGEHEAVLKEMQSRLSNAPDMMRVRKRAVEHPFGTLKQWMGATNLLTRKLAGVSAEMSVNVVAYNYASHENSRYQRFNEGAVGLKRSVFWPPSKVEAALAAPRPS